MSNQDRVYHSKREQQCRNLAELAIDPDVRRRHYELAELHASRAAASVLGTQANSDIAFDGNSATA